MTGTEVLGVVQKASMETIVCVLEGLEDIITDNIEVGKGRPEETRFTTFGYYKALNKGYIGAIEALYGPEDLVQYNTIEYTQLRAYRENFITQQYFDNIIVESQKISGIIDSKYDPNLTAAQRKAFIENVVQYKHLAMAMLSSAIYVGQNLEIKPVNIPAFKTTADMDTHIINQINKVDSFRFPKTINRDLYFRLVRRDYLKLSKHLND